MNHSLESQPSIPEIEDLARLQARMLRPAQNVNVDGSFELGWGTAILCFGLVPYLNADLAKSVRASPLTAWIGYLPMICLTCAAFAPYGIPRMIKRFITWPRSGYVANPNELKLIQLVMIMVFGAALGLSLTLPFLLVSEIREAVSRAGAHSGLQGIILHGVELVGCATLAVYLGRKVFRKCPPLPSAYDASLINQGLGKTSAGGEILHRVKVRLHLMLTGILILVCVGVFGLMYLNKSVMRQVETQWPQLGILSFLVAANAILYLMGNGVAIKQHRWKWLVLAILVVGPIIVVPAMPYPDVGPDMTPLLGSFPPVMLFMGLVCCLSGAATLISFIRHNPLPSRETT